MGVFRFLLALCVIATHCGAMFGLQLLPGNLAVEAFFIISGFYMAMVLTEKYFKIAGYYKLFITNRFLRIYPVYWLVLLLIALYYCFDNFKTSNFHTFQFYIDYWHKLNPIAFLYLFITNILIIGQEYALFFTVGDNGALIFTTHFAGTKLPFYKFLLDVPLWSVSLELVFYLISPLIVKLGNKKLLLAIAVLLILRLLSKVAGVVYDPVIHRLLPYQIIFFLAGILSYNLYAYIKPMKVPFYFHWALLIYVIVFTLVIGNLQDSDVKGFIYLTSVAFAIPFLFELSKSNKIDRAIGELSYSIYIIHLLFADVAKRVLWHYNLNAKYLSVTTALFSIIVSFVIVNLFSKGIDSYRAKRVVKALK